MDPKGERSQGRVGWETGSNMHTNGRTHTVGQLMRAYCGAQGLLTALPFVSSDEGSLFSLLLPAIDYQQRWELGENQFWHTLILFTQPIFYTGPTGTLLFFNLKQTLKSLFIRRRYRCKTVILQPSKRCYLFFFQFEEFIFFFFLFYNFLWSTVDLESCVTYGIRLLHSYFSLFLMLTNSMLTHLGVCAFFFLPLSHHNQDSIIR